MKILLANPRGFCAGVNMAIDALEIALSHYGAPLYVYHEIVHNKHIVEDFQSRGVVFVNSVDEVPPFGRLMYSAHGIAPEIQNAAKARHLSVIDATCPLVRKVHLQAIKYAHQGYSIILIGHAGHDEVIGTMGEAPEQITLVESLEDIDRLEVSDPNKVAYLSQTTLSVDETSVMVDRLKQRFPNCVGSPKEDICYATQNRQTALKTGLTHADVVLVIGSRNSSNTSRLTEIASSLGKPAYQVDNAREVDLAWFNGSETVLITAGASAPEYLVQGCIELLTTHFQATIESYVTTEEHVEFPLPSPLRQLVQLQPHFPILQELKSQSVPENL